MRFIFQFAFLRLQLQGFSTSTSARNRACVTRPSPLVGGGWARDYCFATGGDHANTEGPGAYLTILITK